jgi:hypothetical protein
MRIACAVSLCLAASIALAGCSLLGSNDVASDVAAKTQPADTGCRGTQVALVQAGARHVIYPSHEGRTIRLRAGVQTHIEGRGPCAGDVAFGTTRFPRLGLMDAEHTGDMDVGPFRLRAGRGDLAVGIAMCAGDPDPECLGGSSTARMHLVVARPSPP